MIRINHNVDFSPNLYLTIFTSKNTEPQLNKYLNIKAKLIYTKCELYNFGWP